MKEKILIVEDEFIVANDLRLMLGKAGYAVCRIARTVTEARKLIGQHRPDWVLLDIFLQDGSMGTDLASELIDKKIGYIYISANTNEGILAIARITHSYGFLVKPFREADLLLMLDIARYKHQKYRQELLQKELMFRNLLQNLLESSQDVQVKIMRLPGILQPLVPFDLVRILIPSLLRGEIPEFRFVRTGFDGYEPIRDADLEKTMRIEASQARRDATNMMKGLARGILSGPSFVEAISSNVFEDRLAGHFGLTSRLVESVPLPSGEQAALIFYSTNPEAFQTDHEEVLQKVGTALGLLLKELQKGIARSGKAPGRVVQWKPGMGMHAGAGGDAIGGNYGRAGGDAVGGNYGGTGGDAGNGKYGAGVSDMPGVDHGGMTNDAGAVALKGIAGRSTGLMQALDKARLVAPTTVSVLITGESGTGKEGLARAIHRLSERPADKWVTVNCAAMPSELIESELFGHERGSFTGAVDKRTGKFEQAHGGTLFLDEIGELPIESQVKLLRVLQEKEFERVGGSELIRVDVRVIAATNRLLEKEVSEGRFRLDLYYRLNVFPIELPPLRQRKEDIPVLVDHFLQKIPSRLGLPAPKPGPGLLEQLKAYDWPGNIREMEHLIERAVILNRNGVIESLELPRMAGGAKPEEGRSWSPGARKKTLEEIEMEHILDVLKSCRGKISGAGGAAEVLGIPPSTLNSRLRKLGISRDTNFKK